MRKTINIKLFFQYNQLKNKQINNNFQIDTFKYTYFAQYITYKKHIQLKKDIKNNKRTI